jgi:hypothetical protein
MTQPSFASGPPIPLLVEGRIDPPTLRQFFADLESAAALIGIREKGAPEDLAGMEELPMAVARARLLAGAARAVQIRYRFDGHEWTDTVIAQDTGFRVVRCRHHP